MAEITYKAADIARILGISKATVSLALNDKPGVNAETKAKILNLKHKLENTDLTKQLTSDSPFSKATNLNPLANTVIKVLIISNDKKIAVGDEIDLWSVAHDTYDDIAKSWNCSIEVTYFNLKRDNPEIMAKACNQDNICAVIICGSELDKEHSALIKETIKKPIVIYDNFIDNTIASVQFDNFNASYTGAQYLYDEGGCRDMLYLSRAVDVTITKQRREGFLAFAREHDDLKLSTFCAGFLIEDITKNLREYFKTHPIPDAIFCESFHCSIASLNILKELNIKCPDKIRLVGIDEVPSYMTRGIEITCLQVPHQDRVKFVMATLKNILSHEMNTAVQAKVFVPCTLKLGKT